MANAATDRQCNAILAIAIGMLGWTRQELSEWICERFDVDAWRDIYRGEASRAIIELQEMVARSHDVERVLRLASGARALGVTPRALAGYLMSKEVRRG